MRRALLKMYLFENFTAYVNLQEKNYLFYVYKGYVLKIKFVVFINITTHIEYSKPSQICIEYLKQTY